MAKAKDKKVKVDVGEYMKTVRIPSPQPDDPAVKACHKCLEKLPRTADYFDRDETREDGLRFVCKACRAQDARAKRQEEIDERIRNIDNVSLSMLSKVSMSSSDVPHLAELFQRLLEAFGGVGRFSQHFMAHYLSTKPGSATRMKALETMVRIATKVTDTGAAQLPLDLMTDDDIQAELRIRGPKLLEMKEHQINEAGDGNGKDKKVS